MPDSKLSSSPTRGRPALSEQKIAGMRARISACALKLYQSEGYSAVSMRRLAAEAGCTVMTLYRYFERKIDILRYLWDEIFRELFDDLEEIAASIEDGPQRLHAVSLAYVDYWLQHREHYFLVFMSGDVSQSDVSIFVADGRSVERFSLIYECLASAIGDGVDADTLNLKAQTLLCGLNGISHNHVTISGFPWTDSRSLVAATVSGVLNA